MDLRRSTVVVICKIPPEAAGIFTSTECFPSKQEVDLSRFCAANPQLYCSSWNGVILDRTERIILTSTSALERSVNSDFNSKHSVIVNWIQNILGSANTIAPDKSHCETELIDRFLRSASFAVKVGKERKSENSLNCRSFVTLAATLISTWTDYNLLQSLESFYSRKNLKNTVITQFKLALKCTFLLLKIKNLEQWDFLMNNSIKSLEIRNTKPSIGDDVSLVYSLFGDVHLELFWNSVRQGIISSVSYSDLFLVDSPSCPGSEGGLVRKYTKKECQTADDLGIIVGPLNANVTTGLTVVWPLLNTLKCMKKKGLSDEGFYAARIENDTTQSISDIKSGSLSSCLSMRDMTTIVVRIWTDSELATGLLLDNSQGLILTCRHSLICKDTGKPTKSVQVYNLLKEEWATADILYITPNGYSLDFAVLQVCRSFIEHNKCLSSTLKDHHNAVASYLNLPLDVGMDAIALGCPLLSVDQKGPVMSSGFITNINYVAGTPAMIMSSCNIFKGFSGGALMSRSNHQVIAVIVSTLEDKANRTQYPFINFSIPLGLIWKCLYSFITDGLNIKTLAKDIQQIDLQVTNLWFFTSNVTSYRSATKSKI